MFFTPMFLDYPHTIFNDRAAAEVVCADLDEGEFRIEEDPKGSGRCIIALLDEEDGSFCMYL